MEQAVTFVTCATDDLDAARRFYVGGLGWTATLDVPGEIIFFQVAPGVLLGLFDAEKFAADLGGTHSASPTPGGFTLSQNVASPEDVDRVLAQAVAAGATIVKSGQYASFGGYHGHFSDPNGVIWEIAHNPAWHVQEDGTVHLGLPPAQPATT
jgi:catechol 2,3-dioxygenase-like lactoylglutathione lyase family enzyme